MRALATIFILGLLVGPAHGQVVASIGIDESRLAGTAPSGRLFLFTPDPVQPGSSVSHWDSSATPDLLMEPALSPYLGYKELDVTPAMMQDIGWSLGSSVFTITSADDPGVGFDDQTPFAGAPGNDATTLGDARRNLFESILQTWGTVLGSNVGINVQVSWTSLDCSPASGAVLASASTTYVFHDTSYPHPSAWYHSALAESLSGHNLTGEDADINVFVNTDIDQECMGDDTGFYYGLDGNSPQNQFDLVAVVLHELAHGLGMANFTDESTGSLFQGRPGIYDLFTYDTSAGKHWHQMSNAERVASAINPRKVVWTGEHATAAAQSYLTAGTPEMVVATPAEIAGIYEIGTAAFGPPIADNEVIGEMACMLDDVFDDPLDQADDSSRTNGCSAATNPDEIAGKIALIDRGECLFVTTVANAQAAGAIAAVIVNQAGNTALGMGGVDASIGIPAVSIGRDDGNRIRATLCPETQWPAPRRPTSRREPE